MQQQKDLLYVSVCRTMLVRGESYAFLQEPMNLNPFKIESFLSCYLGQPITIKDFLKVNDNDNILISCY